MLLCNNLYRPLLILFRVGLQAAAHVMTRDPDKHLMMHIGLQVRALSRYML